MKTIEEINSVKVESMLSTDVESHFNTINLNPSQVSGYELVICDMYLNVCDLNVE